MKNNNKEESKADYIKSAEKKLNVFKYSFLLLVFILLVINFITLNFYQYLMIPVIPVMVFSVVFLIFYGIIQVRLEKAVKKRLRESLSALSENSDNINENISVPMLACDFEGNIILYNNKANILIDLDTVTEKTNIEEIIPSFEFNKIKNFYELEKNADQESQMNNNGAELSTKSKEIDVTDGQICMEEPQNTITVNIGSKIFDILHSKTTNQETKTPQYMLYFYDVTLYKELEEKYEDERAVIAILEVDSYEDLMNELKEDKRPKVQAEIEEVIYAWAKRMNAMIRKFSRAKYMVVMSNRYFQNVLAKRFEILDRIKEIDVEASFNATLSVGVCTDDRSYIEMERGAFSALEIALGRGGDQAAVKTMGEYEFYGGKSKAIEKRNRVKARIVAHAFIPIIDESNMVYVMGHQYPDMDAFGAAVGIYKAAKDRGVPVKIVLEEPNETIISVYNTFKDRADEIFIKPDEALQRFKPQSDLVVVVDTHRPTFTECPELIGMAERKVVVDHHRRSVDIIEDTLLMYLEPYASSACELVTEMLQYMDKNPTMDKNEANALLAGMVLDTKNFSVQCGVRTFETAALLRRLGADTLDVKEFMQDDLDSIVSRSNIVSNARSFNADIAISITDKYIENPRLIAAQAADQMLTIRGINTSFVIVMDGDKVCISARSLKDINVQVIMERLGGGGHRNGAATQIEGKTITEVENMLLQEIDRYLKEDE